jgi:HTH-type transcriptional regulator / antitoxin HigA
MELRPITTDEDHVRALKEVELLWDASAGSVESQMLDALATLIDAYERKRWPIAASDPVQILEYAIDELGRSQATLGQIIGRTRASEILNRKRALTIEMIDKIEKAWGIPRQLLAVPYKIARHRTAPHLRRKVPKRKAAARKVAIRKRA